MVSFGTRALDASNQRQSYLSDTGSNNTNANLGNQLDGHLSIRLSILQIMDELRKILDGVNIVVRRR